MTDLQVLAKNIKRFRLLKGMTQTELAKKIGMSPQYFSKIEVAKTPNLGVKYLTAICRELGTQLSELFMEASELPIKFIVGSQNLEQLERVLDKINERVHIFFERGPAEPIFYHPQSCGCAYCKLKKRDKK